MLSTRVDRWLAILALRAARGRGPASAGFRELTTSAGNVRVFDSPGTGPVVVMVPDGPNVVEHYAALTARLAPCRVVCFDMPGFGFSLPAAGYAHSLDEGARVVLDVLDQLGIARATLAFSCANGFYALRAAQLAPSRIDGLVLSQTPSLTAMHAWTARVVPAALKVPVLGQCLGWLFRKRAVSGWYRIALPKGADPTAFRQTGMQALNCGGCFSLAGVVQGLLREPASALAGVQTPCTVIWGAMDRSHRHTDPRSLLELVPHADVIRFEACGHFPDLENTEVYVQVLNDAMSRHAIARGDRA